MDTDVVSVMNLDRARYWNCLALLNHGKASRVEKPVPLGQIASQWRPRYVVMDEFMADYEKWAKRIMQPKPLPNTVSYAASPYYPSTTGIQDLEPMHFGALRNGIFYRGRYIIVKTLTDPVRMSADVAAVAQDERGFALTIKLFQQPRQSLISQTDVFLIKEPRLVVLRPGEHLLCIDHINNIIPLGLNHSLLPRIWLPSTPPGQYAQEGDEAMERQQYWIAIQSYTAALDVLKLHPDLSKKMHVLLNRSSAYILCGSYEAALADCKDEDWKASGEALYTATKSLYVLGRFSECRDVVRLLCIEYPHILHTTWAKMVDNRLLEQSHGIYCFHSMYWQAVNHKSYLNHATFTGPVVVKSSLGWGRGLFTTTDVQAGQLLLCEKAFSFYAVHDSQDCQVDLHINLSTDRMTFGTQTKLVANIISKLSSNPSLIPEFMELYHGDYRPLGVTEVDGKAVIDTFLVERIVSLNCCAFPLNSKENFFPTAQSENSKPMPRVRVHHSTGLWLLGSKINHSCDSNVTRSFIGDFLILRAHRDIPAGTELTFWYTEPKSEPYCTELSLAPWGFNCHCAICTDNQETPFDNHSHRQDMLEILQRKDTPEHLRIELMSNLDRSYTKPSRNIPRLTLAREYSKIGRLYWPDDKDLCIEFSVGALEAAGYVFQDARSPKEEGSKFAVLKWGLMSEYAFEAWILLCEAYCGRCLEEFFGSVVACLRVAYTIVIGEEDTFRRTYLRGFEKNSAIRLTPEWKAALEPISEFEEVEGWCDCDELFEEFSSQ